MYCQKQNCRKHAELVQVTIRTVLETILRKWFYERAVNSCTLQGIDSPSCNQHKTLFAVDLSPTRKHIIEKLLFLPLKFPNL